MRPRVTIDEKAAYAYLSDVQNLPSYFPRITEAKAKAGDEVETTAVIEPPGEDRQTVHGTAWFKHDDAGQAITWDMALNSKDKTGTRTVYAAGPNRGPGGRGPGGRGPEPRIITLKKHTGGPRSLNYIAVFWLLQVS